MQLALGWPLLILQLLLSLLFLLTGSFEHLFHVVAAHFWLILFLLILLILLLLILLLLILLFLLLFFFILVVLLILLTLILRLVLLFLHALHEVVACIVIVGIESQRLLVGFNGFAIELMGLCDVAHVVIGLSTSDGVLLCRSSLFEIGYGERVLALQHQRVSDVEEGLRIAGIAVESLAIGGLSLIELLVSEEPVALLHVLAGIAAVAVCGIVGSKTVDGCLTAGPTAKDQEQAYCGE